MWVFSLPYFIRTNVSIILCQTVSLLEAGKTCVYFCILASCLENGGGDTWYTFRGASEKVPEYLVMMVLGKGMVLREGLTIYRGKATIHDRQVHEVLHPFPYFPPAKICALFTNRCPISSLRLNFETCLYDPLTDQIDTCVSKQGGQVRTLAGDTMPFLTW